jgi:hypothetical protein
MTDVLKKVDAYLGNGGLFNPESMNHEQVRDLVIELRGALEYERGKRELAEHNLACNAQTLADHIRKEERRFSLDDDVLVGVHPGDYVLTMQRRRMHAAK